MVDSVYHHGDQSNFMKEVKNKAKGGHLNELTWVNHILQFVSLEQNFSELVNAVIQGCKRKKSKA